MKVIISKGHLPILIIIFLLGLVVRSINFRESVYFGYDEARDAFVSQEIYTKGDLKLIGPQASAFSGIHHGPLYYYLIGPLFLLGKGDPYFVSVIFRIINTFGIVGVYVLGNLLFTPLVGLLSAFIYSVSYEQFIYAIFTGNPSISNVLWIVIFIGLGIICKHKNRTKQGLLLMFLGAASIPQFDMIGGYSLFVLVILLFLIRDKLKNIGIKEWLLIVFIGLSPLYTYIIAEVKNKFLATKILIGLITGGVSNVGSGDSMFLIFYRNILGLFKNNILDLKIGDWLITLLFILLLTYLISKTRSERKYQFVLVWILSIAFLVVAHGFMPFYSYAGVGIGVIIASAIFIGDVYKKNRIVAYLLLGTIVCSNLIKVVEQSSKSLIVEIKAQPGMKLSDEIEIIKRTYKYSNGAPFTIRITSMPYRIQTVWAYLYTQYGKNIYGYYPYLETGNVYGFPGELPVPTSGTTCSRFLIREPIRGIPENLIIKDVNEENIFSDYLMEEKIGDFILQYRRAKDENCHPQG